MNIHRENNNVGKHENCRVRTGRLDHLKPGTFNNALSRKDGDMTGEFAIGIALLAIGLALGFAGLPNKAGESPRFLRFEQAIVLFPPLVLALVFAGAGFVIAGLH